MRAANYAAAMGFVAAALLTCPKSAPAQPILEGTTWLVQSDNDNDCLIQGVRFDADRTAKVFIDADHFLPGTWVLNGSGVNISFADINLAGSIFSDQKLTGPFAGGDLKLVHSWKNPDGSVGSENCSFTKLDR